jgi:cell wall-associated NlpC family hydrolase
MKKRFYTVVAAAALSLSLSTSAFAATGTVERSVNLRSAPSTHSTVYETLRPGTPFTLLDKVNAYWYKVDADGKTGYLSPAYVNVSDTSGSTGSSGSDSASGESTGTVKRSVNFRSAPSTHSTVYKTLKPNTPFILLDKVNAYWYKVSVDGKVGYLSPAYVTVGEAAGNGGGTSNGGSSGDGSPATQPPASGTKAERVIADAKALLGKVTYKYGVNKPPTVLDCSSFTKYVFGEEGITLRWGTRFQKDAGSYVARSDLQPGDLVFFRVGSSTSIGHVGIYLGNGQFIHNSPSNQGGVGISSMTSGYWSTRYVTGRRVL